MSDYTTTEAQDAAELRDAERAAAFLRRVVSVQRHAYAHAGNRRTRLVLTALRAETAREG